MGDVKYWVDVASQIMRAVDPKGAMQDDADVTDLVTLPEAQLTMDGITEMVSRRYAKDNIYSWVGTAGTVLVAVNPYKELPIYTPLTSQRYLGALEMAELVIDVGAASKLEPHAFAIAGMAYRGLTWNDQALLISGDSGSGKTETAKHCLMLLTEASHAEIGNLDQKVLAANPVLEAYGNAATVRNNNSSRFGKWTCLHFRESGSKLDYASIETYLLEKQRVTSHAAGERGFHIYYQLLSHRARMPELFLEEPEDYRYLTPLPSAPVADDAEEFITLQSSLAQLGVTHEEATWLWTVLSAVLQLGQVEFEIAHLEDNVVGSTVKRERGDPEDDQEDLEFDTVAKIAKLLQVDEEMLCQALTTRQVEVRSMIKSNINYIPLTPKQAKASADSIAKFLHASTFTWIQGKINKSLARATQNDSRCRFMGILDIFGFEIFEDNSFQQLCINYANEKLQEHFNNSTFKEEMGLYEAEGIPFNPTAFVDNSTVLALLENGGSSSGGGFSHSPRGLVDHTRTDGPVGVPSEKTTSSIVSIVPSVGLLPMLDDACKVPKSTEKSWLDRCKTAFQDVAQWKVPKVMDHQHFAIEHFAGTVTYSIAGFLEKNRDQEDFAHLRLLASSGSQLVKALVPDSALRSKVQTTASGNLRRQLGELMSSVRQCDVRYIRCVKPNNQRKPNIFEFEDCKTQLHYSGVFETINIRRKGLPFRMEQAAFVNRFDCVAMCHPFKPSKPSETPWAAKVGIPDKCEAILTYVGAVVNREPGDDALAAAVGRGTLVFYRAEVAGLLETLRTLCINLAAMRIICLVRSFFALRFRREAKRVTDLLAEALQQADLEFARAALGQTANPLFQIFKFSPRNFDNVEMMVIDLQLRLDLTEQMLKLVRNVQASDAEGRPRPEEKMDKRRHIILKIVALVERLEDLSEKGVAETDSQAAAKASTKSWIKEVASVVLDDQVLEVLKMPVRKVLKSIIRRADTFNFQSAGVEECRRILQMPEMEFATLQLQRAQQQCQEDLLDDLRIQIIKLKAQTSPSLYVVSSWPTLRTPDDWIGVRNFRSFMRRLEYKPGDMFKHQLKPIATCLIDKRTEYSPDGQATQVAVKQFHDDEATALFRALLSYSGDLYHPYPDSLAVEFVNLAVGSMHMSSEACVQVMKQLTDNPSMASVDKSWELLGLLLDHAAPSSHEECDLLAGFIWLQAWKPIRVKLLHKLLKTKDMIPRPRKFMLLKDVDDLRKDIWAQGGRQSLALPRGSVLYPWAERTLV